jgi:hypothetical protein
MKKKCPCCGSETANGVCRYQFCRIPEERSVSLAPTGLINKWVRLKGRDTWQLCIGYNHIEDVLHVLPGERVAPDAVEAVDLNR